MPQWYQKAFWEPKKTTLSYLNLMPDQFTRSDGSVGQKRALHNAPPARAFVERDLYSTFFGTAVNDEIEIKLFGDIDSRGAIAVRAYADGDPTECHRSFQSLFEYIDIQKLRTPKGLAWLRSQYPALNQNQLMMEMQAVRMMNCTIWTEGVREIVSAENCDLKFIISDHPVTVFNASAPPGAALCEYPLEPGIELKGTQTIFPLSREKCLILTNLEYAQDPSCDLLSKRTFARRFRSSMVRTDAFIRTRELSTQEVERINKVIRTRAHQFVAAGKAEWIPEPIVDENEWKKIVDVLSPPPNQLIGFGGELFAKYDSGHVHYQDEFGRTEKEPEYLKKVPPVDIKARDACGCGAPKSYAECCARRPAHLRPAWDRMSIRERNLVLFHGIADILDFQPDRYWNDIRKSMTDEKIKQIYSLYAASWPLETDLLSLLPKPAGAARAVYTGMLHPNKIYETALGSALMFDEIFIQHPFINARTLQDEFNPVKNPASYRQEILKAVLFFMQVMPLVEAGLVNLIPDPCDFDYHLREQTMHLAESRWQALRPLLEDDSGLRELAEEEHRRTMLQLSEDGHRKSVRQWSPELDEDEVEHMVEYLQQMREQDLYTVLQEGAHLDTDDVAQLSTFKLAPNFEMAAYIAQATGAAIITDHPIRWKEILLAMSFRSEKPRLHLRALTDKIKSTSFSLLPDCVQIQNWWIDGQPQPHPPVFREVLRYLSRIVDNGTKPNVEDRLRAKFERAHQAYETAVRKSGAFSRPTQMNVVFPEGGIYDSTISRLLLMSSSEHHASTVPMAFFVKPQKEN